MQAILEGQFGVRKWMRAVALSCIVLVLFMAGLEAMHSHCDTAMAGNSVPCAICFSVHANAPAVTVHLLPVLHAVAVVAIPHLFEGRSAIAEHRLFIRPPPSA